MLTDATRFQLPRPLLKKLDDLVAGETQTIHCILDLENQVWHGQPPSQMTYAPAQAHPKYRCWLPQGPGSTARRLGCLVDRGCRRSRAMSPKAPGSRVGCEIGGQARRATGAAQPPLHLCAPPRLGHPAHRYGPCSVKTPLPHARSGRGLGGGCADRLGRRGDVGPARRSQTWHWSDRWITATRLSHPSAGHARFETSRAAHTRAPPSTHHDETSGRASAPLDGPTAS